MTIPQHRDLTYNNPAPEDWFDALEKLLSSMPDNLPLYLLGNTLVLSTINGRMGLVIAGKWRFVESADLSVGDPGGAAGIHYLWAVASANSFAAGSPEVDNTFYGFELRITTTNVAPTGTLAGGQAIAHTQLLRRLYWDGTKLSSILPVATTNAAAGTAPAMINPSSGRVALWNGTRYVDTDVATQAELEAVTLGHTHVYRSGSSGYNPISGAVILFNAEDDAIGWYDPATGKFQPTVSGRFRVRWLVSAAQALGADEYWSTALLKNGVTHRLGLTSFQRGAAATVNSFGEAQVIANGSSDNFQVTRGSNASGANLRIIEDESSTYFEAEYIGQ